MRCARPYDEIIKAIAEYQIASKAKGDTHDIAYEECPDCKGDMRVVGHTDHYDD